MKKLLILALIQLSSFAVQASLTPIAADQINFENKEIICDLSKSYYDVTGIYLEYIESFESAFYQDKRSFTCAGDRCRNPHEVLYTACYKDETIASAPKLNCKMGGKFSDLQIDLSDAHINDNEYNDNVGSKIEMKAKITEKRKILRDIRHEISCKINL